MRGVEFSLPCVHCRIGTFLLRAMCKNVQDGRKSKGIDFIYKIMKGFILSSKTSILDIFQEYSSNIRKIIQTCHYFIITPPLKISL